MLVSAIFLQTHLKAEISRYDFDTNLSQLEVFVPRDGLMKFLGHDHTIRATEFTGSVHVNARDSIVDGLELRIPAKALQVTDTKVSDKTRRSIQTTMQSESVLHLEKHPTIIFEASKIVVIDSKTWEITGTVTLRSLSRNVTFPAKVEHLTEDTISANGIVHLDLGLFDIEPVSALAGAVRTASLIEIRFNIQGHATTE
jgi:polyisoprenoid-binding protein YceI